MEKDIHYDERDMTVSTLPSDVQQRFEAVSEEVGGPYEEPEEYRGSIGRTMFDVVNSSDETVYVLLPRDSLGKVASQAVVRIKSIEDHRSYLGVVVRGPLAIPNGLRADAAPIVESSIRGGFFIPEFHGLVEVEIAGEEIDGRVMPPRFRPLPSSPVFILEEAEVRAFLKTGGDVSLGYAFGHEQLEVAFSTQDKSVLPRHTGILGTTGGGKSTTVARMVAQLQRAGAAVILIDTEGEYTQVNEPTDDPTMVTMLAKLGLKPEGIQNTHLYYLVGRECTNPDHPCAQVFSPRFSSISPYAAMEIFDLTDAQEQRCQKAFDLTHDALRRFVWTDTIRAQVMSDFDEFDTGYPGMTLVHLVDIIQAVGNKLDGMDDNEIMQRVRTEAFRQKRPEFLQLISHHQSSNVASWRALLGKVNRINRLGVFDNPQAKPIDYAALLKPGSVTILDLADTDSPLVNNLIITELLRGVQKAQEDAYEAAVQEKRPPTPVEIIIEEAHEFLSAQRIARMPNLYQQVARIAKRGRKRWLGLAFVTQLPQHLPDEVLGLINNYVIHKIGDSNVISRLRKSIGGIDESLWARIPRLAPGQAVVSLANLGRPLLTAITPAPCKLRMTV
ncbi:MAG: ATP-binding protein [Firmicutes bacterium]|nr:ATP-binding protein [Bacillota bacterium]